MQVFVLDAVVDWGFNVVVSDVDVVWFKDPLPLFAKHPHAGTLCSLWLRALQLHVRAAKAGRAEGGGGGRALTQAPQAVQAPRSAVLTSAGPPAPPLFCRAADLLFSVDTVSSQNPPGDEGLELRGGTSTNYNTGGVGGSWQGALSNRPAALPRPSA